MKRSIVLCSAAALAGVVLTGLPVQATAAPQTNQLQCTAQAVIDAGGSGILVRVDDGTSIHTATAGLADRATGRRVKNKDQFQAGSQTKPFMALLVLQLVASGKVALDRSIETYLPGVVPNGENITARMLLQHTSGLNEFADNPELVQATGEDPFNPISVETALASAFAEGPDFPPGTAFSYSNTGYLVIGLMLEKLTGKPASQLLRERITRPLRLNDTYLADTYVSNTGPGFVRSYFQNLRTDPMPRRPDLRPPQPDPRQP